MSLEQTYAPGSRVRVRGEEWAVEKSLPLSTGGHAVHVHGLTELVRGHHAIFLNTLDEIEPLRPEDTRLVSDDSTGFRQTRLYLETLLRRTPPTDTRIHLAHRAALDPMPYQFVPTRRALGEPLAGTQRQAVRPRILIADGTGLGKTIEAGILLTELIKRGRARRILVVATKALLTQFQRDLWARFTIPLVRLDSEGIRQVQSRIPSNRNPFSYYDRCIISVDTLKNNGKYRSELEQINWDVIVVDECQNVANRGSQRESLARLLASKCDALVLTSATPHNGRPESFANLMRMLDPTSIADAERFTRDDIEHLFVRRFKRDIEGQAGDSFQDRKIHTHSVLASDVELKALTALRTTQLHSLGTKRGGVDVLQRWNLVKAFLSSPRACLESIAHRVTTTNDALKDPKHPFAHDLKQDLDQLATLKTLVNACDEVREFSKLNELFNQLEKLGFDGGPSSPRVIVFSERISTLKFLKETIAARFSIGKPEEVIEVFEATGSSDVELNRIKESFGQASSPVRLLLASDAASEGVNLHYHCHQLFHFDIPWSLIRLTQRNGRIDRYGQKQEPQLHYMVARSQEAAADQQIVDRLIEREKVVQRQLGDVGALLGLYDAEAEDLQITQGVAEGLPVDEIIPDEPRAPAPANSDDADPWTAVADEAVARRDQTKAAKQAIKDEEIDLFALLDEPDEPGTPPVAPAMNLEALLESITRAGSPAGSLSDAVSDLPSLFESDHELCVTALHQLKDNPLLGPEPIHWKSEAPTKILRIYAPESFSAHRGEFLPDEALPGKNDPFLLTGSPKMITEEISRALESDDGAWPRWQLLWEQHPIVEWLLDVLSASYARHEAPLLLIPSLGEGVAHFLFSTLASNEESVPVDAIWFGVEARGDEVGTRTLELEELLKLVGFMGNPVNSGRTSQRLTALSALVARAVGFARDEVDRRRKDGVDQRRKRVRREMRRLEAWSGEMEALITKREQAWARASGKVPIHLEREAKLKRDEVLRAKESQARWINGIAAHGAVHVRLVAVFAGE